MANIGLNILAARKRAGLTQEELADRVGYKTKSAINKIETGVRDLPQKKIAAFAEALGVTPGHLMGWDLEPEDIGAVAAAVLEAPEILSMLQDYLTLSESDRFMVRTLAESLAAKTKKD
jgi:transcriptional regulator with XRE-family HTH domain